MRKRNTAEASAEAVDPERTTLMTAPKPNAVRLLAAALGRDKSLIGTSPVSGASPGSVSRLKPGAKHVWRRITLEEAQDEPSSERLFPGS